MQDQDQMYRTDDGVVLRFSYEPSRNNFQSEKAGRAVFDTALMVEIITPGSTESQPKLELERTLCAEAGADEGGNRKVKRSARYAQYVQQIDAFKAQNGEYLAAGTPISQWAQIDVGTSASLRAAGIHTVEMLASVQDGHLQNLGTGGRVLRDQALAFLNARQFGVPTAQMAAEHAQSREEAIRLRMQVSDLTNRLNAALAEVQALRSGQPVMQTTLQTDPLGSIGSTQHNPGASMQPGSANALTPEGGGEANDQYKEAGTLGQQYTPPQPQQFSPQPSPQPQGTGAPAPALI